MPVVVNADAVVNPWAVTKMSRVRYTEAWSAAEPECGHVELTGRVSQHIVDTFYSAYS